VPSTLPTGGPLPSSERQFFLDEFRRVTIVVSVGDPEEHDLPGLVQITRLLIDNGTRVLLVVGDGGRATALATTLDCDLIEVAPRTHVTEDRGDLHGDENDLDEDDLDADGLHGDGLDEDELASLAARLWLGLSDHGVAIATSRPGSAATAAAGIAVALRGTKLVITDGSRDWRSVTSSFMTLDRLDDERAPRASGDGASATDRLPPTVADAVGHALRHGVDSVNVCELTSLEDELLTVDGAGVLFTVTDFLDVQPFGLDDMPMVEDFVARGVTEGYLLPRPRLDVARLLATGLGVRVSRTGHLVGIGALVVAPYRSLRVGEITSIYTISRFTGEGVGSRLIEALIDRAGAKGLSAVFACTTSSSAAAFFGRQGFSPVAADDLPAAKWDGYDADRRQLLRCLWHTID
jgi:amino-acid N-acetyltransferase